MTDVRGQRSEDRGQRSDDRGQRSESLNSEVGMRKWEYAAAEDAEVGIVESEVGMRKSE